MWFKIIVLFCVNADYIDALPVINMVINKTSKGSYDCKSSNNNYNFNEFDSITIIIESNFNMIGKSCMNKYTQQKFVSNIPQIRGENNYRAEIIALCEWSTEWACRFYINCDRCDKTYCNKKRPDTIGTCYTNSICFFNVSVTKPGQQSCTTEPVTPGNISTKNDNYSSKTQSFHPDTSVSDLYSTPTTWTQATEYHPYIITEQIPNNMTSFQHHEEGATDYSMPLYAVGIICITVIILVVLIIVIIRRRQQKSLTNNNSTSMDYQNLPLHNEGPMPIPPLWNNDNIVYSIPEDALPESSYYAEPYVEQNLDELYTKPVPKHLRNSKNFANTAVTNAEPTYECVYTQVH